MKTVQNLVVGAGISGLCLSRFLQERGLEVMVLEGESQPGGLIRCTVEEGHLFHRVGGHVFNSKIEEINKLFWTVLNKDDFLSARRNAVILLDNTVIGYPLENNLYRLSERTVGTIVNDLLTAESTKSPAPDNFRDFLLQKFGPELCRLYFFPYNQKIWRVPLESISLEWLDGKLPMPDIRGILTSNILRLSDVSMAHSTFFYPKSGGSQSVADAFAHGQAIKLATRVHTIAFAESRLLVNGEVSCQRLYFTGFVQHLASMVRAFAGVPDRLFEQLMQLKYNGTTTVLCACAQNPYSWMYLPDPGIKPHRIIFTGNFSPNNNAAPEHSCTVEFSGTFDKAEAMQEALKLPGIIRVIAVNQEPRSYVINDNATREIIDEFKRILKRYGIYLSGRFAEWQYYNMDTAAFAAMQCVKQSLEPDGLSPS